MSHPSTVRVAEISCCAASRPGGVDCAPHAPESAWQAVNHVRSFICQSPPRSRPVKMDNSPPHRHTATSSCLPEWPSVSQSQRSQFGPSDSCASWCHSDDSNTGGSVQHLTDTEQHFFFHSSSLFGSLSTGAVSIQSLFLQTRTTALRAKTESAEWTRWTNALCRHFKTTKRNKSKETVGCLRYI